VIKVIIIHGNGGATANDIWIPSVTNALTAAGLTVIAKTFPDNQTALASSWLPFIEKMDTDGDTIIVGHSSGALAAMRYAENHHLMGLVLIGAAHTDLGDANEKASGYFDSPWQWDQIKSNTKWVIQFASTDDPYIPATEQEYVRDNLNAQYHEFHDRGHFMTADFPELTTSIIKNITQ
jgi:predicted alpha/beta hydrolase family esterase